MPEVNLLVKDEIVPPSNTDINAEYIFTGKEKKRQSVLQDVSRSILVESIRNFFDGVKSFFYKYIRHFVRCLVYFISPTLKKKPFENLDYKENARHAFEFVIIVLAALIFMIKADWIPTSPSHLLEVYENDISQMFLDLLIFGLLAISYIGLAALSILFGRFFRQVFRIRVEKHESDILQVYLNNAFFSITAVIALIIRSVASFETHDSEQIIQGLIVIIFPVVGILTLIWSVRFAMLQQMKLMKGVFFCSFFVLVYGLFYMFSCLMLCAFVISI